jgi:hypothetical protein
MDKQIRKAGLRAARRHPWEALRISLLAVRHRRAVVMLSKATRRASRLTMTAKQAAANPKVQAEARLAVSDLARAGQRARRVGVANAYNDKQVVTQLRQASSHVSRAVAAARHPRPKRRIIRATAITAGAGALGGAAYTGWRAYSGPPSNLREPATATDDGASQPPA